MAAAVNEQVQMQLPFHCPALAPAREAPSLGCIGFLEHALVQREIIIALEEVFGIPVAALHPVEIAAIDMDGCGQAAERVRHRMDHVAPQRLGASLAQRSGTRRLDQSPRFTLYATAKDIVLAARV